MKFKYNEIAAVVAPVDHIEQLCLPSENEIPTNYFEIGREFLYKDTVELIKDQNFGDWSAVAARFFLSLNGGWTEVVFDDNIKEKNDLTLATVLNHCEIISVPERLHAV